MASETVVRYIRISGQSEGIEKIVAAQEKVAIVSEAAAARQLSLEKVFARLARPKPNKVR